jgi:hypothetical protein
VAADVHAQDVLSVGANLLSSLGELDAARFAAPADLHLRFDHHRVTSLVGLRDRRFDRIRNPTWRDGNAEAGKVLLALVLEQVHSSGS